MQSVLILLAVLFLLFSSAFMVFKYGKKGIVSFFPPVLIVPYYSSVPDAITVFFTPVIVGGMTGYVLRNRMTVQFYLTASSILVALVMTASYLYMVKFQDFSLDSALKMESEKMVKAMGVNDEDFIKSFIQTAKSVIPFIFFLQGVFISMFGFIVIKKFFEAVIEKTTINLKGIEFFKVNDYFVFALIFFLAIVYFGNKLVPKWAYFISLNSLLVLLSFYFIQSLGIIKYLLVKNNKPVILLPISIVLVLLFSIPILFFTVVFITGWGVLDLWADFRKLNVKNDPNSQEQGGH